MKNSMKNKVQDILSRTLPADDEALTELANRLETKALILKVYRSGDLRIPLDRSFMIADALGLDPADFFTACLSQFLGDEDIEKFLEAFGRDKAPPFTVG
jgi:hypothetical protein